MIPSENPAKDLYRAFLWTVPSMFAVTSCVVLAAFSKVTIPWAEPVLWIANVGFLIGTGWHNASLSNHAKTEHFGSLCRTTKFFCLQLFIIPILGGLLLFLLSISELFQI